VLHLALEQQIYRYVHCVLCMWLSGMQQFTDRPGLYMDRPGLYMEYSTNCSLIINRQPNTHNTTSLSYRHHHCHALEFRTMTFNIMSCHAMSCQHSNITGNDSRGWRIRGCLDHAVGTIPCRCIHVPHHVLFLPQRQGWRILGGL